MTESVKTTLLEHKDESNNESEKEITSKDCMVIPEIWFGHRGEMR